MYEKVNYRMQPTEGNGFDVQDGEGRTLFMLRGDMAARMHDLMQRPPASEERQFNCFGTMDYLSGTTAEPESVPSRKPVREWTNLLTAKEIYGFPFGFQLYGEYAVPGEFNMGWETVEGVFHEGLVIGEAAGEMIVFDKHGNTLPTGFKTLSDVLKEFPETKEVRCFDIKGKS